MSYGSLVYSSAGVTSADGEVSTSSHTDAISFFNTHSSTNAVVKINGGPREILVPAGKNYIEITGDYTSFEVVTPGVTVAVFAIG
jgi:hypothetical protein